MASTLAIIAAFTLGEVIHFSAIGGVIGYYWARGDVRRRVFKWFFEHWPIDYRAVAIQSPYDCAKCSTPCNDEMSYCPGCGNELDAYSAE